MRDAAGVGISPDIMQEPQIRRQQSEKLPENSAARSYGFFTISAWENVKDLKMSNKKTGLKGGGLFKSVHWKSNLKSLYQKGGKSQ